MESPPAPCVWRGQGLDIFPRTLALKRPLPGPGPRRWGAYVSASPPHACCLRGLTCGGQPAQIREEEGSTLSSTCRWAASSSSIPLCLRLPKASGRGRAAEGGREFPGRGSHRPSKKSSRLKKKKCSLETCRECVTAAVIYLYPQLLPERIWSGLR